MAFEVGFAQVGLEHRLSLCLDALKSVFVQMG